MVAGNGDTTGKVRRIGRADDRGRCGIADVDHLKTRLVVRDVGVVAGNGDTTGSVWRIHRAGDLGRRGIRDVDHLKECPSCDVGVVAGNGDAKGKALRVHRADPVREVRIVGALVAPIIPRTAYVAAAAAGYKQQCDDDLEQLSEPHEHPPRTEKKPAQRRSRAVHAALRAPPILPQAALYHLERSIPPGEEFGLPLHSLSGEPLRYEQQLHLHFRVLATLNERQARLCVAQRALEWGRGSISYLSRLTRMSRPTIYKGIAELQKPGRMSAIERERIRAFGAGRKKVENADPTLQRQLQRILHETTADDPMSPLKWTNKSTHTIAEELSRRGHQISSGTVGRCLHDLGYSLQANVKGPKSELHRDREAQFRYINNKVKSFLRRGDPVVSVDTKRQGDFRNVGRTWRRSGTPEDVFVFDYPSTTEGKAISYGTYAGEFAVESIRRWWHLLGCKAYPRAKRLLIWVNSGRRNGVRLREWKLNLQRLVGQICTSISFCHCPPGIIKWNKVEHRLFSSIIVNLRGKPLRSYETVVNLIGNTCTGDGLQVNAIVDTRDHKIVRVVSDQQMKDVTLRADSFHPEWNCTIMLHR